MRIEKALIIRRLRVDLSMKYAEICAKSCEEHGLPYEFIDAVEFLPCRKAFESVGAKMVDSYSNSMGNCCCHASHIKSWKRIIEIDKPCIILEHDAVVKGNVKNIDIPDMSVVTFGNRVSKLNEYEPPRPPQTLIKIKRSVGVHACGLTPKTANWLWEHARDKGVSVGVDRWLMMHTASGLPLYICEPPQVVCWARTSTSRFTEAEAKSTKDNRKPKVTNYPETLTKGWKEGLKR